MSWFKNSSAVPPVDILAVCTGNVCRSPYIAALLSAGLPELVVQSAGTNAVVGAAPDAQVLRALAEHDIDPIFSPARKLTRSMVRGSRLIIAATRFHRTQVVILDASAHTRAFTLKELARITHTNHGIHGLEALVATAAATAQVLEDVDYDDDLDDPVGLAPADYERMTAEVDTALGVVIPVLKAKGKSD